MSIVRRVTLTGMAALGVLVGAAALASSSALAAVGPAVSAPVVDSESVSSVTPFDGSLAARITTNNQATEYHFEYGTSPSLAGATTVGPGVLSGSLEEQSAPLPPSPPIDLGGALRPATVYYYRVVATNASATVEGPIQNFTTLTAERPLVEAESVTTLGSLGTTFVGAVNPQFQAVTGCEFQYVDEATFNSVGFSGTPSLLPCKQSLVNLGDGDSPVGVGAITQELQTNATTAYYYRLVAANATGATDGATERLPTAHTGEASAVSRNGATISGTVDPGGSGPGSEVSYYFQYSTDSSYGSQMPLAAEAIADSTSPVSKTAALSGLQPDTTYNYRIVAVSGSAVTYGDGEQFTTLATPPVVGPIVLGGVTQNSATLTTTINAEALPTHYELRLGSTQGKLSFLSAGSLNNSRTEPLTLNIESLVPGSTHYYRLVVDNPDGIVESAEGSFTTAAAPETSTLNQTPTTPLLVVPPTPPLVETSSTSGEKSGGKALTKTQKLNKALKACLRKPKSKRASCKKQARKKYGGAKGKGK